MTTAPAVIHAEHDLWAEAVCHLDEEPERIGFFLAAWESAARRFDLVAWRPIDPADITWNETDFHVSLPGTIQANQIAWATTEGLTLVEAHSHGPRWPAEFSLIDLDGFVDWVPHLWWRLRRRPYAAIVTGGGGLDALCWTEDPGRPEAVAELRAGDLSISTTGLTMDRIASRPDG